MSGQKLIKMDALRKMYQDLGFHQVSTYLQSGNVVFASESSEADKLGQEIMKQLETDFGYAVPVLVLPVDRLRNIIATNPFLKDSAKEEAFLHVTFLYSKPAYDELELLNNKKQEGEEISFTDNAVYLYCPNGYGKTKLTNSLLEAKLKVKATTRNWKTTNELLKMANQLV